MLIIFDLDDTLIDTSGGVTPFKLNLALFHLLQEIPSVGRSFDDLSQELLLLDRKLLKSSKAFLQLASDLGATPSQAQGFVKLLSTPLPEGFKVPTTLEAKKVVKELSSKADLAIVTAGQESYQLDKLKKAGIDTSDFCMIAVTEDCKKKAIYEALFSEFSLPQGDVWVVGDRPEVDLRPAFELGFTTVHMQWGRGAYYKKDTSWVDFSINNLTELQGIIR